MSDEKYSSVDDLMRAVNKFVDDHKKDGEDGGGYFVGFKVHVFLGRGVHEFELGDTETTLAKEVESAKKDLEEAQKSWNISKTRNGELLMGIFFL